MTDEDMLAAKLKGYTCLVKFKDGEELLLKESLGTDDEEIMEWFQNAENYINGVEQVEFFPSYTFAVTRESIKYIKKL